MDTNRIKRFATEARNILKAGIAAKITTLGFDKNGNVAEENKPQLMQGGSLWNEQLQTEGFYYQWMSLYNRIQQKGISEVYEEAAYTWFNRLCAIRILQKNNLCSPVLAYADAARTPVIVDEARQGRIPQMKEELRQRLVELLDDDTKVTEQFAILITAWCHDNPIINKCFGGIADYTELLLPNNILAAGGFVDMLNHTEFITDEDFQSPELIGWLYQFYISERKDEVFAKKGKFEADEIPAATQIFTPNWIVKYMVQNTVGRIYLDNNPYETQLQKKWRYLIYNSECKIYNSGAANTTAQPIINSKLYTINYSSLEELKVADLACGSGHILNECFDLLYDLYIAEGYGRGEAVENIFRHNLTGIDLDTRAKQLSQFALLLKACQKDAAFADAHCLPNVLTMPVCDSYTIKDTLGHFVCAYHLDWINVDRKELEDAFDLMKDADSLGSIMRFEISQDTREHLVEAVNAYDAEPKYTEAFKNLIDGFRLILALTENYHALVMNPPYMGGGNMNGVLSKYVKDNYKNGKADLATVFVEMMGQRTSANGSYAFIIPPSWMFLSTFEGLRKNIIENQSIESLLHLSRGVFGADFGASSAVIKNTSNANACGTYFRLVERTFQEFEQSHLRMLFEQTLANHDFKYNFKEYTKDVTELPYSEDGNRIYYPNVEQKNFEKIPGCPIGYWVNKPEIFDNQTISEYGYFSGGRNKTHGNDKYVRYFWEIDHNSTRWAKYSNAGGVRKYFGIEWDVVDWSKEARDFYNSHGGLLNSAYWNKEGITWNLISSQYTAFCIKHSDFIYSSGAPTIFNTEYTCSYYLLGFLNTKIARSYLKLMNPTINTTAGDVLSLPLIETDSASIKNVVKECIQFSKQDWDAH